MTKHVCEEQWAKGNFVFGVNIKCLIISSGLHFLLSACVGALVFWLTLTILSKYAVETIPNYYINLYSFLVSLPFASLAHVLEDYWWGKF